MGPSATHSPNPTVERHLDGANRILALADELSQSGKTDALTVGWAITALFYSSVHAVRAYLLARHGVVVSSHDDVRQHEAKYPELKKTAADYKHLKQQSESARYYLNEKFTWADYLELRKDAKQILSVWEPIVKRHVSPP